MTQLGTDIPFLKTAVNFCVEGSDMSKITFPTFKFRKLLGVFQFISQKSYLFFKNPHVN